MRKTIAGICVCALLVAGGIALLTERSSAAPTAHPTLLARYEPVLRFDSHEHFFPTTAGTFLAARRHHPARCTPAAPVGGLACFAREWRASRNEPAAYGRVFHEEGKTILEYWYFYDDDVYSYQYPASNFIWQAHEGDWEVVTVVLSAARRPLLVGYSQHCLGRRRAWARTPRVGRTHPLVHVAVGSHANYFSAGTHPIALRCIPPKAVRMLRSRGLPSPVDYAFTGPSRRRPPLHRFGPWVHFRARWGGRQFIHAPAPVGTFADGFSPVGPAYHPVWRVPLRTIASWPR